MLGSRAPETPHEIALDHLLHGTALTAEVPVAAVEAALTSFDVDVARSMFDACLLGQATPEELEEAFGVSVAEATAYAELFFDRSVFLNDFHVMAWIGTVVDEPARDLLTAARVKGFREIRFKFASERTTPEPDDILARVLEGDARQYMKYQNLPLSDPRAKHALALGKHVVETAQIIAKAPAAKSAGGGSGAGTGEVEFVIQSGPLNPTLEELLSKGVQIAN